jgi:hypothetical protein
MARPGRSAERRTFDWVTTAGAVAFDLAAEMALPALYAVHPPTDPAHPRELALGANTFSYWQHLEMESFEREEDSIAAETQALAARAEPEPRLALAPQVVERAFAIIDDIASAYLRANDLELGM